jgi:uncharacterized protein (DUF2164 family)
MTKKVNKFDFTSPDIKQKYIKAVMGYFHDERNEDIGFIAAEQILDFFFDTCAEEIYQKAIKDCSKLIKERFADLEVELNILSAAK